MIWRAINKGDQVAKTSDIQRILLEWARWTSVGGVDIGYPHATPFYRASKMGGWGAKTPLIDDELAGRIDRAVAMLELRCRNRQEDLRYRALECAYLKRMPDWRIGEKLRRDRRTVATARHAAESWVDSQIFTEEMGLALVARTMV